MTKPAFLVEGDLEQKFIQNTCPRSCVQKINCNGDDVSIASIAKRVGTLGRLLHKRCSCLVVIFDRENRSESVVEIEDILRQALKSEDIDVPIYIGIPDRQIENWILSDIDMFLELSEAHPDQPTTLFEGMNGKSIVKKSLGSGRSYVGPLDGVNWLRGCRPSIMKQNSASFRRFIESLEGIPCWWLQNAYLTPTAT
jgi:hypothetical protein